MSQRSFGLTRTLSVCLLLALGAFNARALDAVVDAAADAGDVEVAPAFVEKPGVMEFTGRMVVRPVQREEWAQRGVPQAVADRIDARARARVEPRAVQYFPEVDEYVVELTASENENDYAAGMMATGDYQYVVPDWRCFPTFTPNDSSYGNQWHHPVIQSPQAWDLNTGSAAITCAFVDTGIDLDHPDLASHRVPGFNSATMTPEASGGDVSDINGHGTAVSGTAAAIGNNGIGVAGVGWNQRIMMVRTTNSSDGSASSTAILAGARWAAENGAHVISASYSGVGSPSVETTGAYIKSLGSLFCYAAGNDGELIWGFDHPSVIVCGATTYGDARASFSNYGPDVDVFAPGVNVWSTLNGGGYGGVSGTSFSTPMTNGVISMIWSANTALNVDQVELILFHTCDELGEPGNDDTYGWGRVNVYRAVQAAISAGGPVDPVAESDAAWAINQQPKILDVLANDYDYNLDPLSISAFDSTTPAGAVVTLAPGAGAGGRDALSYLAPAGFTGDDAFSYTLSDGTGRTDSGNVAVEVFDEADFLIPDMPTSVRNAFPAAFYELTNPTQLPDFSLLTPYKTKNIAWLNYASTNGIWYGSERSDNVGAVYRGMIYVPVTDVYEFYTESDDGSALYLNGVQVVDNDGLHGMQERSGRIGLLAGYHQFRVEFFERTGGAGLIVSIKGGQFFKQPIPQLNYFRDKCPSDIDRDGQVSLADLGILLENFGATGAWHDRGDLDGNLIVDLADLASLLEDFGAACP